MLDVISLEKPQRKWASSRLEGRTSWIFSSCGRCSRLTTGTSGSRSGGIRKGQSRFELLGGSRDSSAVDAGALDFVWCRCRNLRIPLQCRHGSCGTSGVSPGSSVLVSSGACTCAFLLSCISSVTLPFAWIKGSVAFPRGFHTRLSHEAYPQVCPKCHGGVSRSLA